MISRWLLGSCSRATSTGKTAERITYNIDRNLGMTTGKADWVQSNRVAPVAKIIAPTDEMWHASKQLDILIAQSYLDRE